VGQKCPAAKDCTSLTNNHRPRTHVVAVVVVVVVVVVLQRIINMYRKDMGKQDTKSTAQPAQKT